MQDIPVTFTHNGKEYKGFLQEVSGAGASIGNYWHLSINKRYWGQLLFVNDQFVFWPQLKENEWLKDFSNYFGEVVTLWYG